MITLHLISHTHWDREWYKPFQVFRMNLVRMVDRLLDLLACDPAYKFFMLDGQTIAIEDYLAIRPERESDLRRYIRQGRILIGPWYILPDEFLVSPEATIRNLLEGARICRDYGSRMPVGYTPDPFGHISQLPQILKGFGIGWAAFRRGLSDEPCELWWEAPDGSRVLTAYLRDGYDNAAGMPVGDRLLFAREAAARRDSLRSHSAVPDLLLMFGTDHMEPPPQTSAAIRAAAGRLGGDRLVHSTLPRYFAALEAAIRARRLALPVVRGELRDPKRHHLLPGVLSTRMWIKQRNRECETLLERWAEPAAAYNAMLSGGKRPPPAEDPLVRDPSGALRAAWRMLLQNHPHDSICGCSIDEVHEEMKPRFAQAEQIAGEIVRASLASVAETMDIRAGGRAVVVFNPLAASRTDRVEAEIHPPADWESFEIVDGEETVRFDTTGAAAQDLVNVVLRPSDLGAIIGNLHAGRAGNLALTGIDFRREGETLRVDAVMEPDAEPEPAAWKKATDGFRDFLGDPGITAYHIRAHSSAAVKVVFSAAGVPGLGWKTYRLRGKPAVPRQAVSLPPLARVLLPLGLRLAQSPLGRVLAAGRAGGGGDAVENEFLRVEAAADGTLTVVDKRNGNVFRGLNRFLDGGDCGDSYNFCPPAADRIVGARRKTLRVRKDGVEQKLEVRLEMPVPAALAPDRKSRSRKISSLSVTTTVALTRGVPRADIHTVVRNAAKDHRLRVHFPFGAGQPVARTDSHFDVIRREPPPPVDDLAWIERRRPELPQRDFADLSAAGCGLMIANRGLPEVEFAGGNEIALTLLRCIGWLSRDDFPARTGHAGPMLALPGAQLPGEWAFDYAVIPHAGDWLAASRDARAFAVPLRAVQTGPASTAKGGHSRLPAAAGSFFEVTPASFEISAVKPAEDGRGVLVRGWNPTDEPLAVRIRPLRKFARTERVNLQEDGLAALRPARDGSIRFTAAAHEIVSIQFNASPDH